MKNVLIPILVFLFSTQIYSQNLPDSVAAVNVAAYGYVGSWFRSDPDGMRNALHPELVKYRVRTLTDVTVATVANLVNGARSQTPKSYESVNLQYELLDISGNIAAVKVTNTIFWDLIFLTKHDTTWLVTNVAWDVNSVPEQSSKEEVESTARDYIAAIYSGNDTLMSKVLHPRVDIRRPVSATEVDNVAYYWLMEKIREKAFGNIPKESLNIQIEVLDLYKSYASVKLTSPGGTEYLHMRYFSPNWYIVNGIWERNSALVTGVKLNNIEAPKSFQLNQNYPNPFNPSTTIQYSLDEPRNVVLKIFNLVGQEVDTLVDVFQPTGSYKINWQPQGVSSGVYLYRLQAGDFSETKQLVFQK